MPETDPQILRQLFDVAVKSALPRNVLPQVLPPKPSTGRLAVVAIGKAAAAMAAALEDHWGPADGIALTRYGHVVPVSGMEVIEAAHPVPDEAGQAAAQRILDLAQTLGEGDQLVVLLSGGASSLMTLGLGQISLAEKVALTKELLASGADITEMNTVRRHLSAIKGGRLAKAAWPARCVTYAISDVPGDIPTAIGSGPTVGDPTTQAQAREVLARYGITPTQEIARVLNDPINESPFEDDPHLCRAEYHLIASPQMMLEAVQAAAPLPCHMLGDAIEGEARQLGRAMAGMAKAIAEGKSSFKAPCLLISGGETTVTLPKGCSGRGGRNVEFLMGFAAGIAGCAQISALACDTDGVDGAAEVAGAVVDGCSAEKAEVSGYPLGKAMSNYDGHGLFERLGDQVITGPTHTNVNDFRAILVR
ncbi:MAG: glycerate kinase type-2 family protein [Mangrovicoccus sp.]